MPNVIAIVDDAKVRSQIEAFCKELGEDDMRVRTFPTAFEFEKTYFAAKKAKPAHPLAEQPGLRGFDFEQLETALATPLSEKSLLPHAKVTVKINQKTGKLELATPAMDANQTLLGSFFEDAQKQTEFLTSAVLAAFKESLKTFLAKLSNQAAEGVFPFKAANNEGSWLELSGKKSSGEHWEIELKDATSKYREPFTKEIERRKVHAEESSELQLLSEIDVVLFKIDCISGKVPAWSEHIWQRLKEGGYFPKDKSTRLVLLKFEDDGIPKLDVIHPRLDDLIFLPLDRLIFLQKMEIIFALPKKATPSFLFSQEIHQQIEISKITKVEKLSDVGLAIRNPVRLVPGLLAHFHLTFPAATEPIDFWGKAVRSEPHPERKGEFLVYFTFFGLKKATAQIIKGYLAKSGKYHPFLNAEREKFHFNPDDLFVTDDQKKLRQVVILELDEDLALQLKNSIPKEFDLVKASAETSFALFASHHFEPTRSSSLGPERTASETDLFASPVEFLVNKDNLDFSTAITAPGSDQDKYFGAAAPEIFATGRGWLKPFLGLKENEGLLLEMSRLASDGKRLSRLLNVLSDGQQILLVRVAMSPGEAPETVRVSVSAPSPDEVKARKAHREKLTHMDLVILDYALVPGGNVDGFMEAFCGQAQAAGILKPNERPKFILTVENEKQIDHHRFTHRDIVGVMPKPIENRQLNFLIATAMGLKFTVYNFENMGWTNSLLSIHVAKEVELEMLSEFGAAICHPRPIAPGTILYLRSWIFDHAPNKCLAARFYHCEEHSSEPDQYLCSLIYFGINDGFMKYARKWFMETYAQSKQTEGT